MRRRVRPKEYYEKLYNDSTVKICRYQVEHMFEKSYLEVRSESPKGLIGKDKKTDEQVRQELLDYMLYRYEKRELYIKEIMEREKKECVLLARAKEPEGITCKECRAPMSFRYKNFGVLENKDKILFIFLCTRGCMPGRTVYEDGSTVPSIVVRCEECGEALSLESSDIDDDKMLFIEKCTVCGHVDIDYSDFNDEPDEYFKEDKKRFCLTDEEAANYFAIRNQFMVTNTENDV